MMIFSINNKINYSHIFKYLQTITIKIFRLIKELKIYEKKQCSKNQLKFTNKYNYNLRIKKSKLIF